MTTIHLAPAVIKATLVAAVVSAYASGAQWQGGLAMWQHSAVDVVTGNAALKGCSNGVAWSQSFSTVQQMRWKLNEEEEE